MPTAEGLELESKDADLKRIRKRKHALKANINRSKPEAFRVLHRAKLPDRTLRTIIRCYAEGLAPSEAMTRSGVSHVTVYRIYGLIRARLLHVGLYTHPDNYVAGRNNQEEAGGPYFDWHRFEDRLRQWMGSRRGIRPENRIAYAAQAIFEFDAGRTYSASQLYRLILLAIKSGGPLNRPARPVPPALFEEELARLMLSELRRKLRRGAPAVRLQMAPGLALLERQIDAFVAELKRSAAEAGPS